MKDYYAILGVSTDAEIEVINAAYRAMAKKYHPDVYNGDAKFAEEKIKDINEAFETLKDSKKRKAYDNSFKKENKSGSFNDYTETSDDNDNWFDEKEKDAWNTVVEYYPNAEKERIKLAKLQKKLALQYQFILITTKTSTNYKVWAKVIEDDFFKRYFGDDKKLHKIVKNLLLKKEIKIALEINKAIKVLGSDASEDIIKKMKLKYKNKINNVDVTDFHNQANLIENQIKNYSFNGNGDEQDYVYDFDYDEGSFTIDINIEVFLEDDEDHEKPYPVIDFHINLEEKYLLDNDKSELESCIYYEHFDELIKYLNEELEKNA